MKVGKKPFFQNKLGGVAVKPINLAAYQIKNASPDNHN
ncbi:hypothetical protein WKT22_00037 [Candidatus Lokiarchaeum ossiferum]